MSPVEVLLVRLKATIILNRKSNPNTQNGEGQQQRERGFEADLLATEDTSVPRPNSRQAARRRRRGAAGEGCLSGIARREIQFVT
ncbi:hypothetical protein J6590_053019 [Homalodisca vitripennis]|nr:hypothetical protein J6590_053019 [Homalodisca vitripennis]